MDWPETRLKIVFKGFPIWGLLAKLFRIIPWDPYWPFKGPMGCLESPAGFIYRASPITRLFPGGQLLWRAITYRIHMEGDSH